MALIPFDDRDGWIWQDGKMLPWRDATLHVLSHGLHYASCVFEGERAYNGVIFKSKEHSERLHNSAKLLGFEVPYSVAELEDIKQQVLTKQNINNGYIRVVAWRGSEMMAISAQHNTIHMAVAAWEWPTYFSDEAKSRGLRLKLAKWQRPSPDSAPVASKAAGLYMICTLSKHEAESEGYDDALMLDYRGYIAEATGANIFFVMGGELHTPKADCFLNGITRQTVIELAQKNDIKVIERIITPDELSNADEVFITGSAAEITPIGHIDMVDGIKHDYQVGKITKDLAKQYSDLVSGRI